MPKRVKWSCQIHTIREHVERFQGESLNRRDIEELFSVGRALAQVLMHAIGDVATVSGAHLVDRAAVLIFLDAMAAGPTVEQAWKRRVALSGNSRRRPILRTLLPADFRQTTLTDLPPSITLTRGRLEITAETATAMLEKLVTLTLIMYNDRDRLRSLIESPATPEWSEVRHSS